MNTFITGIINYIILISMSLNSTLGGGIQCNLAEPDIPQDWIDMASICVNSLRYHIQEEIDASFEYLTMAAYFFRNTVNRPGFAEHFLKAGKGKRQVATTLIEYLSMRGELTDSVTGLITFPRTLIEKDVWKDGADALNDALNMEAEITKSIHDLISKCEKEKFNDYQLVDYLTNVHLDEQYKGQRELAGKLSTLKKILMRDGQLGEFLFDKTLLE